MVSVPRPPAATAVPITLARIMCVAMLSLLGMPSLIHAQPAFLPDVAVPVCPHNDPPSTGPVGKPAVGFPALFDPVDHRYIHSSTHLQGARSDEKWAPLLHMPPDSTGFAGFTSAVVVNNPDPDSAVTVTIDYFDHLGTMIVGGSSTFVLPREQTRIEAATPIAASSGVGSVRVTSSGPGIVGGVLFHTETVDGIVDADLIPFTPNHPGAGSMQQLQAVQGSTEMWWGPAPLTSSTGVDFLNGNAPLVFVVNPTDQLNRVRVELIAFDRVLGTTRRLTWRVVDLPARGTLLELSGPHLGVFGPGGGLWNRMWALVLGAPGANLDLSVRVTSESGLPILGDGLLTDFYGTSDAGGLAPGQRFRMASMMFANTPSDTLITPDFSYEPGGIIQTLIGIHNVGATNPGRIHIDYFDASGSLISQFFVNGLPPDRTLRIAPGSFGYPTTTEGFGWARIHTCQPGGQLIGWAVREVTASPETEGEQFHKAFGESLIGITGSEPGDGFAASGMVRKVMPVTRVSDLLAWPGYTTVVNDSVSNIGPYNISLWFPTVTFSCGVTPTYPGLPWGETATTYEDDLTICTGSVNVSGRVDHTTGSIDGIDVIGDPFMEWLIPGFAGF